MFKPEVRPVVFGRCMVRLLPKPFKTQTAILSFKISVVGSIPIICANSKRRSNGRSISHRKCLVIMGYSLVVGHGTLTPAGMVQFHLPQLAIYIETI